MFRPSLQKKKRAHFSFLYRMNARTIDQYYFGHDDWRPIESPEGFGDFMTYFDVNLLMNFTFLKKVKSQADDIEKDERAAPSQGIV